MNRHDNSTASTCTLSVCLLDIHVCSHVHVYVNNRIASISLRIRMDKRSFNIQN